MADGNKVGFISVNQFLQRKKKKKTLYGGQQLVMTGSSLFPTFTTTAFAHSTNSSAEIAI